MFAACNIRYELAEKARGLSAGGIGAMHLCSDWFVGFARRGLDAPGPVIATMEPECDHPFPAEVRARPDVLILTVTPETRDAVERDVLDRCRAFIP
jgi:nucleoside-triphosphatase THEP1